MRMRLRKEAPIRYPKVWKTAKYPFANLKSEDIKPMIIVKTAVVLFNVLQTGQEFAIFNSVDAGRSWPFMPAWIPLPPAMIIDGPTMEWKADMLQIRPEETVEQLLHRIKDDEELSAHAHAPTFKVLDDLGTDGPFVVDALKRQAFNWYISLQYLKEGNTEADLDIKTVKLIERVEWPDCGFYWRAGMVGDGELCVLASWDDAQMTLKEAEQHVASLLKVIAWITRWTKPVGELLKKRSCGNAEISWI